MTSENICRSDAIPSAEKSTHARSSDALPGRLWSLDVFRGVTIGGMILVNNPGTPYAIYWPIEHKEWNGWTPADQVFPFFLFIVGVSMVFSNAVRRRRGQSNHELFHHALIRGLIIVGLGLFLNLLGADGSNVPVFHFATWRYPGVLQRIGICYLFAMIVFLCTGFRGRIGAVVGLLVVYWALLEFVPVPGFHAGDLSPSGNLTMFIDRALMRHHMWERDAEGILSTLPAIATTLLGVLGGDWLQAHSRPERKAVGLAIAGMVGIMLGLALHPFFPMNKHLWTSTYVVFTGGFAALLLGVFCWLIDLKGWRAWSHPFVILGTNALAVYIPSELLLKLSEAHSIHLSDGRTLSWRTYAFEKLHLVFASPWNASLMFAVSYLVLCTLAMWALYRRRIFIKI